MEANETQGGRFELKPKTSTPEQDAERQRHLEAEISRGIEDAEREQRVIDHRTARRIAEQVHGPDSPLHIFAHTGEVRPNPDDEDNADQQDGVLTELVGLVPTFPDKQAWLEAAAQYALSREDNPGPVRGWQQLTADPELEASAESTPKIYVISVIDQQELRQLGAWIGADQDPEDLQATIDSLADRSVEPGTVVWDIFDHQGFGGVDVFGLIDDGDPEARLATISRVALGIAEHSQPFASYVSTFGADQEECAQFERRYLGRWPSLRAYVEHIADDLGWQADLDALPEPLRDYAVLNYEKLEQHISEHVTLLGSPDGGVYVFGPA